jgi:hypothetical protein
MRTNSPGLVYPAEWTHFLDHGRDAGLPGSITGHKLAQRSLEDPRVIPCDLGGAGQGFRRCPRFRIRDHFKRFEIVAVFELDT